MTKMGRQQCGGNMRLYGEGSILLARPRQGIFVRKHRHHVMMHRHIIERAHSTGTPCTFVHMGSFSHLIPSPSLYSILFRLLAAFFFFRPYPCLWRRGGHASRAECKLCDSKSGFRMCVVALRLRSSAHYFFVGCPRHLGAFETGSS